MGVKSSVFASKAERHNFGKLSRVWGNRYTLYHNLPFLSVYTTSDLIDPSTLKQFEIEKADVQRLKKTSIDYVLCQEDKPLVCIEFDGLAQGYSANGKYHRTKDTDSAAWRDQIMMLKLRVSHASDLFNTKSVPYIIVGSQEFQDLHPKLKLTVIDAIIGSLLTARATKEVCSRGIEAADLGLSPDVFSALTPDEMSAAIRDWVEAQEIALTAANSPVFKANGRLRAMMRERGIMETSGTIEVRDDRATLAEGNSLHLADQIFVSYTYRYLLVLPGQRVTIRHPGRPAGERSITKTIRLPDISSFGVPTTDLGAEIAKMLCQMELRRMYPVVYPEVSEESDFELFALELVKRRVLRKAADRIIEDRRQALDFDEV